MSIECSDCGNKVHDTNCRFYYKSKSYPSLDVPYIKQDDTPYTKQNQDVSVDEQELDESVLITAHRIVSQRNVAYGEPTDTAERVASAFTSLTKRYIKPSDVALIQILFKIVRSEHGYKRDNNVDLAGYTDIRERCFLKQMNGEK